MGVPMNNHTVLIFPDRVVRTSEQSDIYTYCGTPSFSPPNLLTPLPFSCYYMLPPFSSPILRPIFPSYSMLCHRFSSLHFSYIVPFFLLLCHRLLFLVCHRFILLFRHRSLLLLCHRFFLLPCDRFFPPFLPPVSLPSLPPFFSPLCRHLTR